MTENEAVLRTRIRELEQKVIETPAHWSKLIFELDQLRAELADANRGAERNARVNASLARQVNELTDKLTEARKVLEELSECDFNINNCWSLATASKRVRKVAAATLEKLKEVSSE